MRCVKPFTSNHRWASAGAASRIALQRWVGGAGYQLPLLPEHGERPQHLGVAHLESTAELVEIQLDRVGDLQRRGDQVPLVAGAVGDQFHPAIVAHGVTTT